MHNLAAAGALLLALTAAVGVSLATGVTEIEWASVWRAGPDGSDAQAFALWQVRLPRVLLAVMAGWCLAVTGAALQSTARNPLADPGLLGISQGAAVAILLTMVTAPAWAAGMGLSAAAMGGALAAALALAALTRGSSAGGLVLVLMGIALESALSAVTGILLLYAPAEASLSLSRWMAGSLDQANSRTALALLPWVLASLLALPALGRRLRSHELGDALAQALGEDVRRSRTAVLLAAVLLTAVTLPAVGPLMFLGIMAPHVAGALSPATGGMRLLLSGLMGALLLVGADCLTRAAVSAGTLPVGLSLALIGVPLFLLVLRLRKLRSARMS
ncbi:FecCD family ABC transporter permease [Ottowia flava]|uniref:FecCD family ABC transporter permease n=1 Tax=Ottowia flava TaxID=2675430 RepID=A0ABW4KRW2_9BURK|nr:iron ABC transporter permease [Ottowia sp. GY511]